MPSIITRLQHGWNAFMGRDPTGLKSEEVGVGTYYRPDKARYSFGADKSIVTDVITRISIDVAQIDIRHVKVDANKRFVEEVDSKLNSAFSLSANIDQTGRALIQDFAFSICDEGVAALVPTDTTTNPNTGAFDIEKLRVGKIITWHPQHVEVEVYNEHNGKRERLMLSKSIVAIVENPFYAVMNEPNSTLRRLRRTLNNLDILDDQNASGKLDLIIQLPYVVRSETRKKQANERRKEIEMQLTGSKYGIAYTDGTERVTQLNRPIENNYWNQAKELTSMLYNQLGLTQSVFDGTADEATMTNYYSRTIEPILSAITEELTRKFLTANARTRGQVIKFFRDPLKLVTVETLAKITDTFTRSEVASTNEIRAVLGWKPSNDPKADELRNTNMPMPAEGAIPMDQMIPEDTTQQEEPVPEQEEVPQEEQEVEQPTNEDMSDEEIDETIDMLQKELEELLAIKESREEAT